MGISTREILLYLRAKDQASRVLTDVGRAIGGLEGGLASLRNPSQLAAKQLVGVGLAATGIGLALTAAGAVGIGFLAGATKSAMEYDRQARLTLTQIDNIAISLEDVKQVGRDVAKEVAAPFKTLQPALFDIFSSMDVGLADATEMLKGFAKAAVAGNTDVQTAGRATISLMNAFKVPLTDVNRVLDLQFQLVRKGVGDYTQFANVIGRVVPSAVKAGQDIETMNAALAFLTRNGLSAAMAATSTARAFDALSNPKVVANLKAIGIEVTDADGKFRNFITVLAEMREKFKGLGEAERVKRVMELFKGAGGTIQAMRLINLALGDTNGLLQTLEKSMRNAGGAMEAAYEIMRQTPENQIALLTNRWQVFREELGNNFLPVVGKLAAIGFVIVNWLNNLDSSTKKGIVTVIALASSIAIIVGLATTLVGIFFTLAGAIGGMVGGTANAIALLRLLGGGFVVLIGVLALVVANWQTVVDIASEWVSWVKTALDHLPSFTGELIKTTAQVLLFVRAISMIGNTAIWKFLSTYAVTALVNLHRALLGMILGMGRLGFLFKASILDIRIWAASVTTAQLAMMGLKLAIGIIAVTLYKVNQEMQKSAESSGYLGEQWKLLTAKSPEKAVKGLTAELAEANKELANVEKNKPKWSDWDFGPRKWAQYKQDLGDAEARQKAITEALRTAQQAEKERATAATFASAVVVGSLEDVENAFEQLTEKEKEEIQKQRDEVAKLGFSFSKMAESAKQGIAEMQDVLKSNTAFMTQFRDDLVLIASSGNEQLAAGLRDMGAEGAKVAREAAIAITSGKGLGTLPDEVEAVMMASKRLADLGRAGWEKWPGNFEEGAAGAKDGAIAGLKQMPDDIQAILNSAFSAASLKIAQGTGQWVGSFTTAKNQIGGVLLTTEGNFTAFVQTANGAIRQINFDPAKESAESLMKKFGLTKAEAETLLTKMRDVNAMRMNPTVTLNGFQATMDALGRIRSFTFPDKYVNVIPKHHQPSAYEVHPPAGSQPRSAPAPTPTSGGTKRKGNDVDFHAGGLVMHAGGLVPQFSAATKGAFGHYVEHLFNAYGRQGAMQATDTLWSMRTQGARIFEDLSVSWPGGGGYDDITDYLEGVLSEFGIKHGFQVAATSNRYSRRLRRLRADEVPAILQRGEFVINARSASRIGRNQLESMNRMHEGGMVGEKALMESIRSIGTEPKQQHNERNLTVNVKGRHESPQEIAREVDWAARTSGW